MKSLLQTVNNNLPLLLGEGRGEGSPITSKIEKRRSDSFKNLEETPLNIVLYEPQIPPNTGNISRLCVGTATNLHLIGNLGFDINEKSVRRAGLDHWKHLCLKRYDTFETFLENNPKSRLFFFSKFANAPYTKAEYSAGDFLIFGSETSGLPTNILKKYSSSSYYIPINSNIRSINLSNSCAIILYEAIRQIEGK